MTITKMTTMTTNEVDSPPPPSTCTDLADTTDCTTYATNGECNTNPGYMKYQCAFSLWDMSCV